MIATSDCHNRFTFAILVKSTCDFARLKIKIATVFLTSNHLPLWSVIKVAVPILTKNHQKTPL
jgi:hypothetical protein